MEHDTKMEEDIKEIGLGLPDHNSPNKSAKLMDCVAKIVFEECLKSIKTDLQNYTLTIASTLLENKFSYNWENIYNQLEKEALTEMVSSCKWNNAGRLGPPVVDINKKNEVGLLKVKENSLHISSSDNFSTVFGDVCVYKGKWQYEVMLDTKGVMQIGWATLNCKFSKENGVGDTPDSYAYDGNRQRKWNVSAQKYGEMWLCGDIITCLIDLDKGEIGYLRNGQPLGVAFNDLKLGNNMAYFPAMSLAIDESMVVNFGATPFHYPQLNFQALQCPPIKELIISKTCLLWLLRLVKINLNWHEHKECVKLEEENYGKKSIVLMLIAQHIGSALAPLLENPFVVESTLVPILDDLAQALFANDGKENQSHRQFALTFLDYLMLILQEEEMKVVASSLISCLQSYHKRVAQTIDCFSQKRSLKILSLVLSHTHFRKFCLKYVLFENYRFYSFTTINCIDKISLKNVPVPNINYYASKEGDFSHGDRNSYLDAVRVIESSAQELENLQIHFLRVLLTATDGKRYNETSRAIFLAKFRDFLKENFIDTRTSFTIPNQDMLSLFHRCFYLFTLLWEEEVGLLGEGTIYPSMFYDGVLSYHDIQRLGGLLSHLQKTFHEEKEEALNKILKSKEKIQEAKDSGEIMDVDMISLPSTSGTVLGEPLLMTMQSMEVEMQRVDVTSFIANKQESNSAKNELRISLLHFLDGIILLYHHAGHKQVEKIIAQSDVIFDNVNHLEDFIIKKKKCLENVSSTAVIEELDCSIKVMETKLKEQSYQHAWNLATTLSNSSVLRLLRIWKLIYGVLKSSSTEKNLFAFVPEFYIETLTELSQDLRQLLLCKNEVKKAKSKTKSVIKSRFFRPGGIEVPDFIIEEYESLLIKVGEFLSLHFCDNRIIYADSKDSLIQALAGFVCHKPSLEALEKMSEESQLLMVYSLLQPYENRAWAQNNWILVRFWKGKGFGFRFTKSPHLANKLGPKPAHCEIPNIVQSSVPSPSEVFLNHIANVLQNEEVSTPFLNSLLNQLNWVFSEFIGMLQEIQNASNRPERVFIDSRQLRICATCFDLTLALLRVLEMVVSISIEIFVDQSRPNSQSMVTRLCQLMCQVLNRVSVGSGCFSHVVNLEIPGLETIHYFPILTSVTGILCQLLRYDVYRKGEIKFAQVATSVLLSEASFQLAALYPLLGDQDTLVPLNQISLQPGSSSSYPSDALKEEPTEDNCTTLEGLFITPQCECKPPKFCFRKYPNDIKDFEIKKVVDLLHHLEKSSLALSSHGKLEDSDTFCTICYARFPDARFEPCHHTSCVTCITHYLMNKTFCFFCKMPILEVVESTSNKTLWKAPDDPQLQKLDS